VVGDIGLGDVATGTGVEEGTEGTVVGVVLVGTGKLGGVGSVKEVAVSGEDAPKLVNEGIGCMSFGSPLENFACAFFEVIGDEDESWHMVKPPISVMVKRTMRLIRFKGMPSVVR